MVEFTSIPIKDKEIERINNKELNWIGDNELWQLQEKSDSDYGNLFIEHLLLRCFQAFASFVLQTEDPQF